MKMVDTHCHLDDERFEKDREEIFKELSEKMEFVVNIGYDLISSKKSVEYAKENKFIYAAVGIHPSEVENYTEKIEQEIKKLLKEKKVVALGEIGLDYHWMTSEKEHQKEIFKRQMKLAATENKPVVIHSREALKDTIDIIKEFPNVEGIFHCYPGSIESARLIPKNYYFGVGGVLTFKNSKKTVEFLEKIDLSRIVLETDSPYLTPVPFRGKRNNPLYVKHVAEKIADLKGISFEEVIKITTENAKKIYKIE